MKKSIIISAVFLLILAFIFVPGAKSITGTYHNGDALYYKGVVYLTTANSGMAEVFKIDNNKIIKTAQIKAVVENANQSGFVDAMLNIELGGLYLFLTDGVYLYKYDLNDPANPFLIKRVNDQVDTRFTGLGKIDNKIYTVSDQGIKIWNDDLVVYYNARLTNVIPHNIKISKSGGFVFNIAGDRLEIFDAYSQKKISAIGLDFADVHERGIYNDADRGTIYVVDDSRVKEYDFSGKLLNSFKHTSKQGYDIAYDKSDDYLFFSDGIGIVKLRKSDLKPLSWIYTKAFSDSSGWATGLKVVRDNYGEKIIVFHGNGITVLNQDFKKIGTIKMPADAETLIVQEGLSLTLNSYAGAIGSQVSLSGQGYNPAEPISLYLADKKFDTVKADDNGRFCRLLTIPSVKPGKTDIKAVGDFSHKSYGISFDVTGTLTPEDTRLAVNLDRQSGAPGAEVLVSGRGFDSNEYILIFLAFDKIGVGRAQANGTFSQIVKIPATAKTGATYIRASGYDSVKGLNVDFTVN